MVCTLPHSHYALRDVNEKRKTVSTRVDQPEFGIDLSALKSSENGQEPLRLRDSKSSSTANKLGGKGNERCPDLRARRCLRPAATTITVN